MDKSIWISDVYHCINTPATAKHKDVQLKRSVSFPLSIQVVADPSGVGQQMADRDRPDGTILPFDQMPRGGIVEAELAGLHKAHDQVSCEALGQRGYPK
jgi:hypothetical protein